MAAQTYSLRALVLRRTKLGESDVICTLLAVDGSQVRAVAKGARKPTSTFASRLEVYAVCDLLLVRGRNLDIVKEARLVQANEHLRRDISAMEAAAPMVELMDRCTQAGLEDARLFAMTCKALDLLRDCPEGNKVLLCAAHLLKSCAVLGFRPRFDACVGCGAIFDSQAAGPYVRFSYQDGGLVCDACRAHCETAQVPREVVMWGQVLIYSTFDQIIAMKCDPATSLALVRFLQLWVRQHIGANLKSLSFLVAVG